MLVLTVLVGTAISAAVLLATVPFVGGLVDRQRARAAADAAALAGVVDGRPAAAALASANGAVLVEWSEIGDEVVVTVEVDGQRASARATDAP
ncbi:MAG: hypothetical protein ACLGHQ_11415 [Acidimicrobiia bacterium]